MESIHVQHQWRQRRVSSPTTETPELRVGRYRQRGGLSIEEFRAGGPKGANNSKSEELFKAIDSDSNGSVTKEEQDAFKTKAEQAQQQLQSFLFGLQAGGQSESSSDESEEETDIFAQLDANSAAASPRTSSSPPSPPARARPATC